MSKRFTAAHWGAYRAKGTGTSIQLEGLEKDPAPSPIADGWIDAVRDESVRILRPAVRKGWLENRSTENRCDDVFVETDWDTALDLVSAELERVRVSHGNEAIFGGSYGWSSAGRFHHAQSQLRRFLNTIGGCTVSRDTYSHAAGTTLFPYVTGMSHGVFQDNMTSLPLVAEHCELLVAFGGISSRTAQVTSSGTSFHEVDYWLEKAVQNGTKVINISPQRSDFSEVGRAEWLAIRPNTDTALMIGLAHELRRQGLHDEAFLDKYCNGWEAFEAYLTGEKDGVEKTADWAASICDIAPSAISDLATRMVKSRTMIAVNWGIQRADHGEQPVWMGLTLAAMLGEIGKPGTGFSFGYGSTTPVGRPNKLIRWPSLPQGKNPISQFIPVARIGDMLRNPGGAYRYNGEERKYPDIRLIYWVGGNPFHHHQDLYRLEEAWTRPDTIIVNEQWWTGTARRADIVLPATSPLERQDIMMNRRDPCLIWMEKLFEPVGQARDDHDIFCDLAERMGTSDEFTEGRSKTEWLQELWARAGQVAKDHGIELPEFEAFKKEGLFDCPDTDEIRLQFEDFIKDPSYAPLNTASGKIEILSEKIKSFGLNDCKEHPMWIPPIEWLGNADPDALHLVSGQPATRLHSQLDNGSHSKSGKVNGREPAYLHPATAAARDIADGDVICLYNSRGKCLAGAILTDGIREDTISLATGAWFDPQWIDGEKVEVHGNPNVLTIDKGSSELGQGNIAHTAVVQVAKWTKPLPPILAHTAPKIERAAG